MKHQTALGTATLIMVMLMTASANAQQDNSLGRGSDACLVRLPPQYQQFEQNIGSGMRLIFRKTKYLLVYTANQQDECGAKKEMTVLSALEIPPLPSNQWFGGSFDCADPTNTVTRGKPFIGIFAKAGNSAKTKALRGWTVDFHSKKFVAVDGTTCYSFDK